MTGTYSIEVPTSRPIHTLNDPRFLTVQASFTFLPAGTVIFSIWSTNSGSSVCPETETHSVIS